MNLFLAAVLAAALPQHAYLWQRSWNDDTARALTNAAPRLDSIVALAAETSRQHNTVRIPLDFDALRATGKPIGLALRADTASRISVALATNLLADVRAHGLAPSELQVDFDCAETKLLAYRDWLAPLQRAIAPTPLIVTALPSWLRHEKDFRALLDVTDGFVLQVHSLERPANADAPLTLCDDAAARRAVARAAAFGKKFRVALPTYGYVVGFGADGQFLGLSAEGPSLAWPGGTLLREVRADPAALATLVREWRDAPPANCTGIIWYRLPTDADKLNWRWPTLDAVITGKTPRAALAVEARQTQPGLIELDLVNRGDADALTNIGVTVVWRDATLSACDALAGFDTHTSVTETNATRFLGNPRLAPSQRRAIGWLRFRGNKEVVCETKIE
jgi:hypothetical protein